MRNKQPSRQHNIQAYVSLDDENFPADESLEANTSCSSAPLNCNGWSGYNQQLSSRSDFEPHGLRREESTVSFSSVNLAMPHMEERMRRRLKYFFMNPCQKYKAKRRKPFKLIIQMVKVLLVTSQLIIFGYNNQARVDFMEENQKLFEKRLILDNSTLISRQEFYIQVNHISKEYAQWQNNTLGIFGYSSITQEYDVKSSPNHISPPIRMCAYVYKDVIIKPAEEKYFFDKESLEENCYSLKIWDGIDTDKIILRNGSIYEVDFIGLEKIVFSMGLNTVWMQAPCGDEPDCYNITIDTTLDNEAHSGQMKVRVDSHFQLVFCSKSNPKEDIDSLSVLINIFDAIIIMICSLSFVLCIRSLWKAQILRRTFEKFYLIHYNKSIGCSDKMEFFNGWYLLIVISDVFTILGTLLKMILQNRWRGFINYDFCSLFLGLGCLFLWTGVLRYAGFFNKYNILVVTLRKAMPHVCRFMVCASVLYLGFMFCGWVVLGPYHVKFRSLVVSSEALFSLINGDDMYMTFEEMSKKSTMMLVFSQIYLYTFISLFIYVVLSLFIAVIMDTYETLKEYQEGILDPNLTEIQKFIAPCTADVNQENYAFDMLRSSTPCCCCLHIYDDSEDEA